MEVSKIVGELNEVFALQMQENSSEAQMEELLAVEVNRLIETDFNHLVYILYRIDIDEQKLKELLKNNAQTDAGLLISRMIIDRQRRKILTRQRFENQSGNNQEERF